MTTEFSLCAINPVVTFLICIPAPRSISLAFLIWNIRAYYLPKGVLTHDIDMSRLFNALHIDSFISFSNKGTLFIIRGVRLFKRVRLIEMIR